VRWLRLASGILLGAMLVGCFWFAGWLTPPETLQRRAAVWTTLYPLPTAGAEVDLIPCEPLRRVRFYVICTEGCDGVWRIVAVKGLQTTQLANLARTPPESVTATRRRFNEVIGAERVRPDDDGMRRMVAFYLRLEGLDPALLLGETDRLSVEETRPKGEEALRDLAEAIAEGNPLERIPIERTAAGAEATVLYWETARSGWPVLEMRFKLAANGEVREVRVRVLSSSAVEEEPSDAAEPPGSEPAPPAEGTVPPAAED
jgi:hypothetical protein